MFLVVKCFFIILDNNTLICLLLEEDSFTTTKLEIFIVPNSFVTTGHGYKRLIKLNRILTVSI